MVDDRNAVDRDIDELLERIAAKRGYLYEWQRQMAQYDPEFLEAYEGVWDAVFRPGPLSPSQRQLLLVAVLAGLKDQVGLTTQIRRALRMGISSEEIVDTLKVTYVPGGALSLVHGLRILSEVTEESGDEIGATERKAANAEALKDRNGPKYATVSRIRCRPEDLEQYVALRREVINPAMRSQHGFVSSVLLKDLDAEDEFLLINRWFSETDSLNYRASSVHDEVRNRALELLPRALETKGYAIVPVESVTPSGK